MAEWTTDYVAARFEEASTIGRRLARVGARGYVAAWPTVIREDWERLATDDDPVRRPPPSPQEVDRMLETMRWVQWLDVETRHIVWMRAQRYEWHQIGRRVGCHRVTAGRRWQEALKVVVAALIEQDVRNGVRIPGPQRVTPGPLVPGLKQSAILAALEGATRDPV